MLTPAYSSPEDFVAAGFPVPCATQGIAIDLVIARPERAAVDGTIPSHAASATRGRPPRTPGYGSGAYRSAATSPCVPPGQPEALEGLCLLAPYLGSATSSSARSRRRAAWLAGGRRRWRPMTTNGALAVPRRAAAALPVHLGLGREDRFAARHRVLARGACRRERVDIVPGGHDWPAWRRLWEHFLRCPRCPPQ